MTLVALAAIVRPAPAEAPRDRGPERRAPLTVESPDAIGKIALDTPVVVDRLGAIPAQGKKGPPPVPILEAIEARVLRSTGGAGEVTFRLVIESHGGERIRPPEIRLPVHEGEIVRIPVGAEIPPAMEGALTVRLSASAPDGTALFEGRYGLGYPRYSGIASFGRIHEGAILRDDFDAGSIDEDRWRIWLDDPDHARVEVRDGRLVIHAEGARGYNGLSSRVSADTRDVEAVCVAGVESRLPEQHPALVHLCGAGAASPDNWLEVRLAQGPDGTTVASTGISVPPGYGPPSPEKVTLAGRPGEGHVVRIVSDPAARLVRGLILDHGAWRQVGSALEIPARDSRLEIKTDGFGKGRGATTLWFDDCRLYPRPETHDFTIKLQRAGGAIPGGAGPWPQVLFGPDDEPHTSPDIVLELLTADGATVVGRAHPTLDLAYATFPLDGAPWQVYPAGAILRLYLGGIQLGKDMRIPASGVEGLYPDDVWTVTLR